MGLWAIGFVVGALAFLRFLASVFQSFHGSILKAPGKSASGTW